MRRFRERHPELARERTKLAMRKARALRPDVVWAAQMNYVCRSEESMFPTFLSLDSVEHDFYNLAVDHITPADWLMMKEEFLNDT